jgi:predicted dehydrogenase
MPNGYSRRELIKNASMAAGLAAIGGVWTEGEAKASRSPNEKLNLAHIGCGGQGGGDLSNTSKHPMVNIVALCDVDDARAADSFKKFPDVKKFKDFRKMLEQVRDIDAVVVSIPDHMHAPAAVMAMKMGKHVYCQKPLAHSVAETRAMQEAARKHKVVTQMGTQAHGSYAPIVELIRAGAIGAVREVHTQTDRPTGWWPQGMTKPTESETPLSTLDWDLWLGVARERPYNKAYLPFVWRGWWDFGTGAMGDMACHLLDGPFWALDLKYPTTVESIGDALLPDAAPKWMEIRYEFPQRGDMPPVKLTWYDGGKKIPAELLEGEKVENGSVFVGDKGKIVVEHNTRYKLLPESQYKDYKAPEPTLPRSPGHYIQWIDACRTGGKTDSNFDYACPLTETALLGNVAFRVGKKIEWDSKKMRATNCPDADAYIQYHYRKGWRL